MGNRNWEIDDGSVVPMSSAIPLLHPISYFLFPISKLVYPFTAPAAIPATM